MPVLGEHGKTDADKPAPVIPNGGVLAVVLEVGATLKVNVPSFGANRFFEVEHWVGTPAVGDQVLVTRDEGGAEWVIAGIAARTSLHFVAVAAAAVPNDSMFKDSVDGVLKFKDGSGTVYALY